MNLRISTARELGEAWENWKALREGIPKELISLYVRLIKDIENLRGYEYKVGINKDLGQQK